MSAVRATRVAAALAAAAFAAAGPAYASSGVARHVELSGDVAQVPALVESVRAIRAENPSAPVFVFIAWQG